jgi:hypothetical protein
MNKEVLLNWLLIFYKELFPEVDWACSTVIKLVAVAFNVECVSWGKFLEFMTLSLLSMEDKVY